MPDDVARLSLDVGRTRAERPTPRPGRSAGADSRGILLEQRRLAGRQNYIEYPARRGPPFWVGQMLTRVSVKTRLEAGLSFIEFRLT